MKGRSEPRVCFLGNLDSIHVRRWVEEMASRGVDVHFVSYRRPAAAPAGVTVHVLRDAGPAAGGASAGAASVARLRLPAGLARVVSVARYRRAGLRRVLREIAPDVLHAHYVSDYGVIGAESGFRPLVLSAWGSDVLVDAVRSPLTRRLVRAALAAAAAVTYDSEDVAAGIRALAGDRTRLLKVVFGVRREELARALPEKRPQLLSARSLEPNYRVDAILRAWAEVEARHPGWSLAVAGGGSLRSELEALAGQLGLARVTFLGRLERAGLLAELGRSAVYVSVPASDGASATLLEAMAMGCYPVVSDLPANREWVSGAGGGVAGGSLAAALEAAMEAMSDPARALAVGSENRRLVAERGIFEDNLDRVLALYRELAGARA